jgi:undecaprenyl-phosphate 4-deoxy-4-formamido-L-arabinose transferase
MISQPAEAPTPTDQRSAGPLENTCDAGIEVSFVVPVFNSRHTLPALVDEIHEAFQGTSFEVVLVNDGSTDGTGQVVRDLAARYPATVCAVNLARNFVEHSAVLAGLRHAAGDYVAVLDDDGQNPPAEVGRMIRHARAHGLDAVYGRQLVVKQPLLRRVGSRFHNAVANLILRKPRWLYLSSFKVLNRFLVDEIAAHHGPRPYLDGLVIRATNRIGQIDVLHRQRGAGRSGYTLPRLVGLWLDMVLGFSTIPLRIAVALGLIVSLASGVLLGAVVIDKLWFNPQVTVGIPTVLSCIAFFSGMQLMVLGVVGEYVARVFAQRHEMSAYVVRSIIRRAPPAKTAIENGVWNSSPTRQPLLS